MSRKQEIKVTAEWLFEPSDELRFEVYEKIIRAQEKREAEEAKNAKLKLDSAVQ